MCLAAGNNTALPEQFVGPSLPYWQAILLALVAPWALVVPPALMALQTVEGWGVSPDVAPLVATLDLSVCSLAGEADVAAGAAGEVVGQTATWPEATPAFAALKQQVLAALAPCPW